MKHLKQFIHELFLCILLVALADCFDIDHTAWQRVLWIVGLGLWINLWESKMEMWGRCFSRGNKVDQ